MTKQKPWEEEFDEKFSMYNPISDIGTIIPTWNGADFKNIKDFISQQILKVKREGFDLGLEGLSEKSYRRGYKRGKNDEIKMGKQKRIEEYKQGYNQAIKDFKIPNKFGEKSL